jgi:hypothetical protein
MMRNIRVTDRHSYSGVSALPAWWLMDADGNLVASIRAATAVEARDLFKREGLSGVRVKRAEVAPVEDPPEERRGPVCEICKRAINEAIDYRTVTGWERISRGGAGGTHAIRAPDRTAERFACMFCVDKLANGVSPQQETLAL